MAEADADRSGSTDSLAAGQDRAPIGGAFSVESLWQACETSAAIPVPDPLIGRSFDGLTPIRVIAEGGMGRVYEAEQATPPRRVALKIVRPGLLNADTLGRFHREVTMLASLRHPCIANIHSAGSYSAAGVELPYFVMELIAGGLPLTDYARSRQLSVLERLTLFEDFCAAIAHGHSLGIVHRDLKPTNLLVDELGRAKVIDFGIARWPERDGYSVTLTEAGQLVGTLQYMSPEQFSGVGKNVDTRSDVYSLGVVLYELLADQPPFELRNCQLIEAAYVVQTQRPKPLRSVHPTVPRRVAAIVQRCLAKDRHSRFTTAGDLLTALQSQDTMVARMRASLVEGCDLPQKYTRAVMAGVASAMLILAAVYLTPPLAWPPLVGRIGTSPPSQTIRVVSHHRISAPSVEAMASPAAARMLQPVFLQRDSRTFRFAVSDVHQQDADAFLLQQVGMKKWTDQFMFPRVSYWAPVANDIEGLLVYRFDFGGIAASIHLRAISNCWDFFREPGGVGRGASAIEVSRDGKHWVAIENNLEPRRWGATIAIDKDLPGNFTGADALWLRIRCVSESAPVENGYNVAQFARTRPGPQDAVFEVNAALREADFTSD